MQKVYIFLYTFVGSFLFPKYFLLLFRTILNNFRTFARSILNGS